MRMVQIYVTSNNLDAIRKGGPETYVSKILVFNYSESKLNRWKQISDDFSQTMINFYIYQGDLDREAMLSTMNELNPNPMIEHLISSRKIETIQFAVGEKSSVYTFTFAN